VPHGRRALWIRAAIATALGLLLAAGAATIAFGLDLDDGNGGRPGEGARANAGAIPGRPTQPVADAASSASACGTQTAATIAAVQSVVAQRIYAGELRGTETRLDAARVAGYHPLLEALARGDQAGVRSAVHALVYKPHWHIVRLRVTSGGRVLADVGGPHILAPVRGTLRANGRALATYTMSVQDDLGYVKLVSRFIGAPIDIYQHGSFVMGTLNPAPAAPAPGASVAVAGVPYQALDIPVQAFPSGPLQATLFLPAAPSGLSCAAVRLAAWGSVARHVAARFKPLSPHLRDLADLVKTVTGARLLVRSGTRQIVAGGPARLPQAGSVSYAGRRWAVYSWQPLPAVRAYLLTPP
jgi:hypothetical protein